MSETVGFIGLGIMGRPMAANLIRAGHSLTVHSRRRASAAELEDLGAEWADTPAGLAAASDIVFTMLPDSPDVEAAVAGEGGLLGGARDGSLVVDMSTISPVVAVDLNRRLGERGIGFIDAPVSGADVGAREGTLSIMAGGDPGDLERAMPLFDVLGSRVVHVGGPGAGQTVKACNQMVVAASLASLSEALVLAEKAGVAREAMLDALSAGLAASRVIEVKRDKLLDRDFEPGFKAELHLKDLRIAFDATQEHGVAAPVTGIATQLMTSLVAAGHGEEDHSGLLQVLESLSGTE